MIAAIDAPPALAGSLILARMILHAKTTPKTIRGDVSRLLGRELPEPEFQQIREQLRVEGLLNKTGRALTITEAGRRRALDFLGLEDLPPRTTWRSLIESFLLPKALGTSVEAATKLRTGGQLAALFLKRHYGLPADAGKSVKEVLEALVCRELGHPEETTLTGLLETTMSRMLRSDQRLTRKQLIQQLPLFQTGLARLSVHDLRQALVRSWLLADTPESIEPPRSREFDLAAFAATVRTLARLSPPGERFHDNKAFIAPLWRASQREPGFPHLTLPEFKERLIEANRAGLLRLSRADLVPAMDPALVADSETAFLNSTFHFVLIEGNCP